MSLEFTQLSLKYNSMLSIIKENIQTKLFFLQYQELVKNLPRDYMCYAQSLQSCLTLCNPIGYSLQAPLSMEFFRQEYWSGLPFPSPGDLPNPGVKLRSPVLQADTLPSEPPGKPKFLLQHQELIPSSQRLYRFLNFVLYFRVLSKHIIRKNKCKN